MDSLTQEVSNLVQRTTELTDAHERELLKWQAERDKLAKSMQGGVDAMLANAKMTLFVDENAPDGGNGSEEQPLNNLSSTIEFYKNKHFLKVVVINALSDITLNKDQVIGTYHNVQVQKSPNFVLDLNGNTLNFINGDAKAFDGHARGKSLFNARSLTNLLLVKNGVVRYPSRYRVEQNPEESHWYLQNDASAFMFAAARYVSQRILFDHIRFELYEDGSNDYSIAQLAPIGTEDRNVLLSGEHGRFLYSGAVQDSVVVFWDCTIRYLDPQGLIVHKLLDDVDIDLMVTAEIRTYKFTNANSVETNNWGIL